MGGQRARRTWVDDEAGLREAGSELHRFARRALARPLWVLLIALAVTSIWTVRRLMRMPLYQAQIVFRIVEDQIDTSTAPQINAALRAWVNQVALSHQHLAPLIRERGLYPKEMARGPDVAVERMREDIDVEVWRNYFLESREKDEVRDARVALRFKHQDPELACAVLRRIGDLVVADQRARRQLETETMADTARFGGELARREMESARRHLEDLLIRQRRAPGRELILEIAEARREVSDLDRRVGAADERLAAIDLRRGLEDRDLGMVFQIVDAPHVPPKERRGLPLIFASAIAILLLLLPLSAMAMGSFDTRIYDLDDVRRLGVRPLGHLAAFPGWRDGDLEGRRQVRHRVR